MEFGRLNGKVYLIGLMSVLLIIGAMFVGFLYTQSVLNSGIEVVLAFVLLILGMSVVFALLVSYQRRVLLNQISNLEKKIAAVNLDHSLSYRLPPEDGGRFALLIQLVNNLLDQVELSFKAIGTEEAKVRRLKDELLQSNDQHATTAAAYRKLSEQQGLLLDNIDVQVWYLTDPETMAMVNQARADFRGLKKEEMENFSYFNFYPRSEAVRCVAGNERVFRERKSLYSEEWLSDGSGRQHLLAVNKVPKLNENGQVEYVVCMALDITDYHRAQQALMMNEELYRRLVDLSPLGVLLTELNGQVILINRSGANMLGVAGPSQLTARSIVDFIAEEYREKIRMDVKRLHVSGYINDSEIKMWHAEGGTFYVEVSAVLLYGPGGQPECILAVAQNVTERRETKRRLEYLSLHDQLTGLYNRAFFEAEMERLENGREYPISIVSMDLNGLKLINDTMGHSRGDVLLRACADILREALRKDDIITRVGGDEFAVILPFTSEEDGETVVNRIRQVAAAYNKKNPSLPVGFAIGIATSQSPETSLQECCKRADHLMYNDKLYQGISARGQIVNALLAALSERDYITTGHATRLEDLCSALADKLGLSSRQKTDLSLLARVHDLGKVGIPDNILFKPGGLNDEEWEIMRQHAEKGYRIAHATPDMAGVADLILRHHERFDGRGYPLGIAGLDIPVECRVLAIVDTFDAMTHTRPYAQARTSREALMEIQRCSGTQFDPYLVQLFTEILVEQGLHMEGARPVAAHT